MAVPGGQLIVVEGFSLDGAVRRLMPQAPLHGSFWRPDLSFDGKRVLFCFKPHNEKSFHIYEINIDGTGLRQLTSGIYDDFDPVYLPDGRHYVFSSTRGHTYVRCMPPTNAYNLMRALDGGDSSLFRQQRADDLPSVMNTARVSYTRGEYPDTPLWRCRALDREPAGTQPTPFGATSRSGPTAQDAARDSGSRRVMFTAAPTQWFAGTSASRPDRGSNFQRPDQVTAELPWPESGNGPVDPARLLSIGVRRLRLVSDPVPAEREGLSREARAKGKFALYPAGYGRERELLTSETHFPTPSGAPRPVLPRARPVTWPTRESASAGGGTIYSRSVSRAPPELRGPAKYLPCCISREDLHLLEPAARVSTGPCSLCSPTA
jgi:hypothetical protein